MVEMIKGIFPNVTMNSRSALEFYDIYCEELNNGTVYFVAYRIGRLNEYGFLCDGIYMNIRAYVIQTYNDFFERVFSNSSGKLSIKIADTTHEEFVEIHNDIMNTL